MLHRQLQTAQGFYNLGMTDDAWEELGQVALEHRHVPEYLQLSLAVLMKKQLWDEAVPLAEKLCQKMSDMPDPFLHLAFCLHEQGQTEKARNCLLQGPPSPRSRPTTTTWPATKPAWAIWKKPAVRWKPPVK